MVWKNKFHERINELWKRAKDQNHKMTQTEYARRLGVTRNALLGWLRGSGRKRKTEGIEEQVWAELDSGKYRTHKDVAEMLEEKFGIKASVNLAARVVKRWKQARADGEE